MIKNYGFFSKQKYATGYIFYIEEAYVQLLFIYIFLFAFG